MGFVPLWSIKDNKIFCSACCEQLANWVRCTEAVFFPFFCSAKVSWVLCTEALIWKAHFSCRPDCSLIAYGFPVWLCILKFRQIHFAIWDKYILQFGTNTFSKLDKYKCVFDQEQLCSSLTHLMPSYQHQTGSIIETKFHVQLINSITWINSISINRWKYKNAYYTWPASRVIRCIF